MFWMKYAFLMKKSREVQDIKPKTKYEVFNVVGHDLTKTARKAIPETKYFPNEVYMVHIDLKNNCMVFDPLFSIMFSKRLKLTSSRSKRPIWLTRTINIIDEFFVYGLGIYRKPSFRRLKTLFLKQLAIMSITKESTDEYKQAEAKHDILYSMMSARKLFKDPDLIDFSFSNPYDSILQLLSSNGERDVARKIEDIWLDSGLKDSDRKKFRNAMKDELLKRLYFKEGYTGDGDD